MKKYTLLLIFFSAACAPAGMPLEEQVSAVKACKQAGGTPQEIRYADGEGCAKVNCYFGEEPGARREKEAKPCLDKGGVPIYSSWDGTLKDCQFPKEKITEKWAYAFVCKNIPPAGQANWIDWLKVNGECTQIAKEDSK